MEIRQDRAEAVGAVSYPGVGRGWPGPDVVNTLAALRVGVVLVARDWTVLYLNPAAAAILHRTGDGSPARLLWELLPEVGDPEAAPLVRAAMADGAPRTVHVTRGRGECRLCLEISLVRVDGGLALEVSSIAPSTAESVSAARGQDAGALRALARQLAATPDTASLLEALADAAAAQCGAEGAAVAQLRGDEGEFVAVTAGFGAAVGTRFPLADSLTRQAVETRTTVNNPNYLASHGVHPALGATIGPLLLAPLLANDRILGVLSCRRAPGAVPFGPHEERQLRVIADYASLVLWKSQLLEEAESASRAKGNFLATMSHELRTPLAALSGYGELLADEILGPLAAEQLDVVERMRSVTHHLSVMIEEILTFSSIEVGRESVRVTEFLVRDVIQAVEAVIDPLAHQKKLSFVTTFPSEPVALVTDVDKVRQILVNLGGNAVKFTERGGVRIVVERCEGIVRFAVHDTGIGIAPGDIPRLFHPFAQLDTGLTRRHNGTGLGLYISHRLAKLLGGRIEVRSTSNEGSTFTLVVPATHRPPPPRATR